MTDFRQISYSDIKNFLISNKDKLPNKKIPLNTNDAYNLALDLLRNVKAVYHPLSIIKWMIAYNLIINKVYIPTYTSYEIDNMSQFKIIKLTKLLNLQRENKQNIKDILNYLGKLDEKNYNIELHPELNGEILGTFHDLETNDIEKINIYDLRYKDVINLLKTHNNKAAIRKFINKNLDKIIVSNIYGIYDINDINEYILVLINVYNKYIMTDIIKDIINDYYIFEDRSSIINDYFISEDKASNIIKHAENNNDNEGGKVYIEGKYDMYELVNFTFCLLKIDEKGLAKRVFDISNKLRLFKRYYSHDYSYNQQLAELVISDNSNILKTIIDFMGENKFIEEFFVVWIEGFHLPIEKFKQFIKNLIKIAKYDLICKILTRILSEEEIIDYFPDIINNIDDTVKLKNKNLIMKYIDIYYLIEEQHYVFDVALLSKISNLLGL